MAANVESMFYTREKPWHGLGVQVQEAPTSEKALWLAGLDWKVLQKNIYTEGRIQVPGYKANVRNTDGQVLGIVTDRYKVIQNEEAFAFTDELLGKGVRYETAGSLQNGKKVWMLARLPKEYIISGERISPYYTVRCHMIKKNNGVIHQTVMISDDTHNASPCYDMNHYYELYQNPEDISIIADDIIKMNQREGLLDFSTDWIIDKEQMLEHLMFRIVSTEKNSDLLENVPHHDIPELNLSMLFYLLIDKVSENYASILLWNQHMQIWKTSETELFEYAWKNTPLVLECDISSMEDLLNGCLKEMSGISEYPTEPIQMYVITNKQKLYGAGCILYPEILENLAQKFGSDFYILPSSVHETIAVPADSFRKSHAENLKTMVIEINRSELMCEEVLSDNVYYYSSSQHKLFLAA